MGGDTVNDAKDYLISRQAAEIRQIKEELKAERARCAVAEETIKHLALRLMENTGKKTVEVDKEDLKKAVLTRYETEPLYENGSFKGFRIGLRE